MVIIMNKAVTITIAVIVCLGVGAAGAFGQARATADGAGPEVIKVTRSETPDDSVQKLDSFLNSLSEEELSELVSKAVAESMAQERAKADVEIRQGLLYMPEDVKAARRILSSSSARNPMANIEVIYHAMGRVDPRFARIYKLYKSGKKTDAAKAIKLAGKLADANQATYLSACVQFSRAECLAALQQGEAACDVWQEILVNMPDRLSFAAMAAKRSAEVYEQSGRFQLTMQMYQYLLSTYPIVLSQKELSEAIGKIRKYAKIYDKPLKVVAEKMGFVQTRLAGVDSGKETQASGREILAILEDLIKTAEEQRSGEQNPKRKKGKKQGDGETKPCPAGGAAGKPKPGTGRRKGSLVPGSTPRTPRDGDTYDAKSDGDWASLPSRQREEIRETIRKAMSDRHKNIANDYHKSLSKDSDQ